jgi:hypothetical protein
MSNSLHHFASLPDMSLRSIVITTSSISSQGTAIHELPGISIKADIDLDIMTGDLPRIIVSQPIIWKFSLIAIYDLLLKDPVIVSNAISHRRNRKGRKRVEETGGKTSKAAVSKRGVRLLFQNILHVGCPEFLEALYFSAGIGERNLPVAIFFMPTLSIALSSVLPIKNSRDKSALA